MMMVLLFYYYALISCLVLASTTITTTQHTMITSIEKNSTQAPVVNSTTPESLKSKKNPVSCDPPCAKGMCCSQYGYCGTGSLYCEQTTQANPISIPWNEIQSKADLTYFNGQGLSACGVPVNATGEDLAAVSYEWFTSDNPNYDQLCDHNVCVNATYAGKSVKVPVKDKCESCKKAHLQLSQPPFAHLVDDITIGHVYNAEWSFVPCS